jgi:release factor glutamine methyltransferase
MIDDVSLAARALELGTVSFLGFTLEVAAGALVPRPETELLARVAIDAIRARGDAPVVVDVGCGAGNLACAIARALPAARVYALDIAPTAVALTRRNAERLGVSVTAFESDVFAALPSDLRGRVDAIVANPPYISTSKLEGERAGLLANEPREAFDAGPYGLALHQRIVADARTFLRADGLFACEFGRGQERQLRIVLERARGYTPATFHHDEAGAPRALTALRLSEGSP